MTKPNPAVAALAFLASVTALQPGYAAHAFTLTTLYSFSDGADGGQPNGGVIQDAAGTLYGETFSGGLVKCSDEISFPKTGCGTVYSFTPAGGLKVLVNFTGPNGAYGNNGLTLAGTTLYGSTVYGGVNGKGVLFSVHTDGTTFTLLHQFKGQDGRRPDANLLVGQGGVLYGITQNGGAGYPSTDKGVLFKISPTGAYTVLHNFTGGADGANPSSLLITSTGTLVGATLAGGPSSKYCSAGCGTVFSYSPSTAKYSLLYTFPGSDAEGGLPYVGSVGPGPTVYGASYYDIFSLSTKDGFTSLEQLTGSTNAVDPLSGPLYEPGGTLYGVASSGPSTAYGELYTIQNGVFANLYDFNGGSDGGAPEAQPIVLPNGSVIGTTASYGNCNYCGTIWEYTP